MAISSGGGSPRDADRQPRPAATTAPGWPGLTTAQSLAVASEFGVTMAVGVGLGIIAGHWLDGQIHTGILLTLIGAFLGLASGITGTVAHYRATLRKSALEWREVQTR